jgi:hypothetical protein
MDDVFGVDNGTKWIEMDGLFFSKKKQQQQKKKKTTIEKRTRGTGIVIISFGYCGIHKDQLKVEAHQEEQKTNETKKRKRQTILGFADVFRSWQ